MTDTTSLSKFKHREIEPKWQQVWQEHKLFQATTQEDSHKDKLYLLFAFAYPSGSGLHVGHVESKTALDILARFGRMNGKSVLFPVGWDAFGLPAENYAVKTGVHPAKTTKSAIDTFRRQIKRLGISYDWATELATCHPGYYQWTQWLFLKLYEKGLAYKAPGTVNWCSGCQTVLANEQVVEGECERCGTQVIQKQLEQWYFRITDYKDELISGLDQVDWPKPTEQQQKHWIGKKTGINITYQLVDESGKKASVLVCFTTRPDTNFGATFVVIAPEHAITEQLISGSLKSKHQSQVKEYYHQSIKKTERERQQDGRKKTGVFTGLYAVNPLTESKMPVYVSDFVLAGFGTGAVVGVPAHDRRDFEFAKEFELPVIQVVKPQGLQVYRSFLIGAAEITDADLTNLQIKITTTKTDARKLEIPTQSLTAYLKLVADKLEPGFWNEVVGDEVWFVFKHKSGKLEQFTLDQTNTEIIAKLCSEFNSDSIEKTSNLWLYLASNDWYTDLMVQEEAGIIVNSDFLNGLDIQAAIEKMMDHLEAKGWGKRVDTYRLRDWLISRQRYWGAPIPIVYDPEGKPHPVRQEHLPWLLPTDVDYKPHGKSPLATSAEFKERTEKLYGKGWRPEYDTMDTFVDSSWYFLRYPMMAAARDSQTHNVEDEPFDKELVKHWLPVDFYMIGPEHVVLHLLYARFFTKFLRDSGYLDFDEPFVKMRHQGMILGPDHKKMSKSKGNVIDPDIVVDQYGADTLRVYEMFMGPIDADKPWDDRSVVGVRRFLDRIYKLINLSYKSEIQNSKESEKLQLRRKLHQTIKKVTDDIPQLKFNTAIASLMELVNEWDTASKKSDSKESCLSKTDVKSFVLILAPFAPFLAEELWQKLSQSGNTSATFASVHTQPWPKYQSELLVSATVPVVVQVNGKVRAVIEASGDGQDLDQVAILELAKSDSRITKWLDGKKIVKEIVIPAKTPSGQVVVNLVVK